MHSLLRGVTGFCVLALLLCQAPRATAQSEQSPSPAPPPANAIAPIQQTITAAPPSPGPQSPSEVVIGSGDLLEISVYGAPEFTRQVRVADSGDISLPLLGVVHVAGLTLRQAELLLQKSLSDGYFTNPQVSIFEKEYGSQGISVLGEVQKPGIYPLPGARKLFDAISAAGGVTAKAGNTITITHRGLKADQTLVIPPNQTFPPESNVAIFPGDTVVVSKAGIVYVIGDVRLPGGFILENSDLTVLQAVAMAQGTNTTAKLDNTLLIRKTPEGPKEIPVRLSQIMAAKAPDVKVQPDDIVFVPRSAGKAAMRRGLEAILQTATGVAIYGR
ncbi:MAG: polysaccharide biosynthesis/export family protein [Chlamydiota bacterium]